MLLNEGHPVHTLVQQTLPRQNTLIHPYIGAGKIRAALAIAGVGLDHHAGEQAMAYQGDANWETFSLVTDRRVIGATSAVRYNVRFSAMMGVKVNDSWLDKRIFVDLPGQTQCIANDDFAEPLGHFLQHLAHVHPQQREPSRRPLCAPSDADPSGVEQALAWLGEPDERTAGLLRFIQKAHETSGMPLNVAHDLVRRVVLMHRNAHFGRAMTEGRWLSPVSRDDLSNAIVYLFGHPMACYEGPVRTLELASGLKTEWGGAAVSSAVGLASAAILGFGWTSTPKQRLDRFRFQVADTPSSASFRAEAQNGRGLEHDEPGLLNEIDAKLLPLEDAVLVRRVVYGWDAPTLQLLETSEEAVSQQIRQMLAG